MGRPDRKVSIDELDGAIEELLKAGSQSVTDITRALGWSTRAICPRLEQLELEQRAHRVRVRLPNSPTLCYQWHAGPDPDHLLPAFDGRDPLVAALFGPARRAAA